MSWLDTFLTTNHRISSCSGSSEVRIDRGVQLEIECRRCGAPKGLAPTGHEPNPRACVYCRTPYLERAA